MADATRCHHSCCKQAMLSKAMLSPTAQQHQKSCCCQQLSSLLMQEAMLPVAMLTLTGQECHACGWYQQLSVAMLYVQPSCITHMAYASSSQHTCCKRPCCKSGQQKPSGLYPNNNIRTKIQLGQNFCIAQFGCNLLLTRCTALWRPVRTWFICTYKMAKCLPALLRGCRK